MLQTEFPGYEYMSVLVLEAYTGIIYGTNATNDSPYAENEDVDVLILITLQHQVEGVCKMV